VNESVQSTEIVQEANAAVIMASADHLAYGGLVALPTETVYGLAADATNGTAVAAIFEAKNRPHFNPLICHVYDGEMAAKLVNINAVAQNLIDAFWPGPLTLVLPALADNGICDLVTAGLDTLAVRMPANEVTRAIIEKLGKPIAAPSANLSGKISPTTAAHVAESLSDFVKVIVDDGPTSEGIESTIVAVNETKITLLRPGTITQDAIEEATGLLVTTQNSAEIIAPGMMQSHYAPDTPLILNAELRENSCFMIGFGAIDGDISLSQSGDLKEAASKLFASLRQADKANMSKILVAPIPHEGLGIAINDRLERAAAPK